jgi:hypothetical protein
MGFNPRLAMEIEPTSGNYDVHGPSGVVSSGVSVTMLDDRNGVIAEAVHPGIYRLQGDNGWFNIFVQSSGSNGSRFVQNAEGPTPRP